MTSQFSARNQGDPLAEVCNEQYSFGLRDVNHLNRFAPGLPYHSAGRLIS